MAGRDPEHEIRLPVLRQAWRDVLFVHWPYAPDDVAERLPEGFVPDTYDGRAWVALSAFRVAACNLGPLPPWRQWSFLETNLRTYVVGPDGSDGLWFLDIEAETLPVSLGARGVLGAPYHHAVMELRHEEDQLTYTSRRRWEGDAGHAVTAVPGDELSDGERAGLVDWCTGRWRSWTTHLGLALCSPVSHEPWRLHHAQLLDLEETLTAAAGLPAPSQTPLVHWSPGVDARFAIARPHRSQRIVG